MNISESVRIGIGQLMDNKTRSFLTILGMLIGIGSVVGVISLGEGLRRQVIYEMDKIGGSRLILVEPPSRWIRQDERWVKRKWEEHLTVRDIERISRSVEGIERVTPLISS
jgi:putative ABC transport system permease protein